MKKVENAGIKGMRKKRKPFHITSDDFFHETKIIRLLYSQLIDNLEPNRVVIIPSVSYGISNVIHNLPFSSGKIIVAGEQFPSNVYPWHTLRRGFEVQTITAPDSENRGEGWNTKILDAINNDTRVVAIGHVHWSDGTLFKLKEIREKLDLVDGLLIIDGTQSVGAFPFSVKQIRPDALICAAYKWLMAPYSIGLAYYGKVFDQGTPIEENWINRKNSDDFATLVSYHPEYREYALKYEVGEHSNFILIPMLRQALKQLLQWKPENIQEYCGRLMETAIEEMKTMGYKIENPEYRGKHLFGARLTNKMSLDNLKKSFYVNKVSVSIRGNVIRISPNVYNDEMDVRKLLKAMKDPIFTSKSK